MKRDFGNRGVPVETQVSFMNGQRVPYGTPGSTRPDLCIGNSCSIEVKNYDITNNRDCLVDNVVNQAIYRDKHIPAVMKQIVIIDIRGQNVDLVTKGKIQSEIYTKTNGIIDFSNVIFKDK